MSVPYCEEAIPGRHSLTFRIRDYGRKFPVREVEVLATPDEIDTFVRDGYLVRENIISMETVERLRTALDETVAKDDRLESGGKTFGGVFIRHLMDKHPAFLELRDFAPALSVARALFGPAVQVRGFTGRVCSPDDPFQETEWHFHQRIVPDPLPPLMVPSHTMDVLLYLDAVDDLNGPLCVIPGSHKWMEKDLPGGDVSVKQGEVVLRLPPGSCVLTHGSLWHRAMPTLPGGTRRRLLLWGYGPCWLKPSIYGRKPEDGLTEQLLQSPDLDEETRELLGVAGFM